MKIGRGAWLVCGASLVALPCAFSACSTFGATGTIADGGADAADAADASPFCGAVDASFCSDFDEPDLPAPLYRWDSVQGGTEIWNDAGSSPPAALHAAASDGGVGLSFLSKTFYETHVIHVEFDFKLPALPRGEGLISPIVLRSPDDSTGASDVVFLVGSSSDSAWFQQGQDQSRYSGTQLRQSLGADQWHHVVLAVDTDQNTIDAAVDTSRPWQHHPLTNRFPLNASSPRATDFSLSVGAASEYDLTSDDDVLVDNVVVQAQ
jgi:hypothetical protein